MSLHCEQIMKTLRILWYVGCPVLKHLLSRVSTCCKTFAILGWPKRQNIAFFFIGSPNSSNLVSRSFLKLFCLLWNIFVLRNFRTELLNVRTADTCLFNKLIKLLKVWLWGSVNVWHATVWCRYKLNYGKFIIVLLIEKFGTGVLYVEKHGLDADC